MILVPRHSHSSFRIHCINVYQVTNARACARCLEQLQRWHDSTDLDNRKRIIFEFSQICRTRIFSNPAMEWCDRYRIWWVSGRKENNCPLDERPKVIPLSLGSSILVQSLLFQIESLEEITVYDVDIRGV